MELWPQEYEALRAELREQVAGLDASMRRTQDADQSVDARVAEQRAIVAAMAPPTGEGTDQTIAGIPCRLYHPTAEPRGVYLHFHGGGMILGEPSMNDADNQSLADHHQLVVVSVDYRLAPEHPHPAGLDDAMTVAAWLLDHAAAELGSSVLLTGGESAGAYVAASVLLRLREEHRAADRISGANLVFGVFDWGGNPSQRGQRPSDVADLLTPEAITFFTELYLPGRTPEQRRAPEVSPAHADLTGLPPALMTVGTADHLLDDTLVLAARWAAFGNQVDLHVIPDAPHGFQMFGTSELARRHHQRMTSWFESVLDPG
ncbi:MAG: alpha/beta hydrolase fold domain-containing protein [Acidimicrobiia bacterium]|nr:alpha/beta hydrolase fold domain-containing protein [Acidimicrobiia bacterium]